MPLERGGLSFLQKVRVRVDMYGPVWLCATLVFVIAAGSTLNSWLRFSSGGGGAAVEGGIERWRRMKRRKEVGMPILAVFEAVAER